MVDHLVTMANLRAPGGARKGKGGGASGGQERQPPPIATIRRGQSGSTRRAHAGLSTHAMGRAGARWTAKHDALRQTRQPRHVPAGETRKEKDGSFVAPREGKKGPRAGELRKLAARAEAANAAARRSRPPKGAPLPPAKISYRSGPAKAEGGKGGARPARGGGKGGERAETRHAKGGTRKARWSPHFFSGY